MEAPRQSADPEARAAALADSCGPWRQEPDIAAQLLRIARMQAERASTREAGKALRKLVLLEAPKTAGIIAAERNGNGKAPSAEASQAL